MKKTSYTFTMYRFEFVRDKNKKYHHRNESKSRDRLKIKHRRTDHIPENRQKVEQRIERAMQTGVHVQLLLFGYFQHQQMIGQVVAYDKELQIVLVHTKNQAEWIDIQDIINVNLQT